MELLASDESGAVLVYECVECGYQSEERVENVLEPLAEEEADFQPEDEEEEELPEEEGEEELDESLWEEDEEEDAWR